MDALDVLLPQDRWRNYQDRFEILDRSTGQSADFRFLRRNRWGNFSGEHLGLPAPRIYDFQLKCTAHWIALYDFVLIDGETRCSGLEPHRLKNLRDKITFLPAGTELSSWASLAKPGCILSVTIVPDAHSADSELSRLHPMLAFEDIMLRSMLAQIRNILADPTLDTPGYAETLVALLPFEVVRAQKVRDRIAIAQGGLAPRQLRTVMDFMEDRLAEGISIGELANSLELSRFHFIRAFKRTVGVPPHRYFLARRIEQAKELLRGSQYSVSEVAKLTGFHSVTQLSRVFKKLVGVTPKNYRRES